MAILEVRNIEKHFGRTNVLKDVSFSMEEGNALAIIGSSGSGKTTLLRCLNFLERPDSGQIIVNGETLFEMLSAESQTRSIGYQNNIKNIISSILVVLIRAYTGNSVSTEITSALSDDRRINIIDYMFLYKYSTVTRDELAKKLNLSQRQLHRILLKQYGKTFSELKREARLNKARELLQNGKTYEEAVAAVGYSDMRSFLKLIKKK